MGGTALICNSSVFHLMPSRAAFEYFLIKSMKQKNPGADHRQSNSQKRKGNAERLRISQLQRHSLSLILMFVS